MSIEDPEERACGLIFSRCAQYEVAWEHKAPGNRGLVGQSLLGSATLSFVNSRFGPGFLESDPARPVNGLTTIGRPVSPSRTHLPALVPMPCQAASVTFVLTVAVSAFATEDLEQLIAGAAEEFVRSEAWMAAPPPVSTARYTHAVRLGVDAMVFEAEGHPITLGRNPELAVLLQDMGSEYSLKYEGMWAAFASRHPDYMRHVAISGQELIRGVLQYFVPDADLDSEDRRSLIKPRIRRMLARSDSGTDWVWHFSQGAVGFYQKFDAYAHDDSAG